jgi:hypothetical protein
VRQRADQVGGGIGREHGVVVEGDDVAHVADRLQVAHHYGEGALGAPQHELVELGQLAPLALPPHPDTLARVPPAGPVEEIERILAAAGVAGVERADALDRRLHDRGVALARLGRRVGEVAQHREVEVRLPVGQELDLEVFQRLAHRLHAPEESRDDDRGAELGRDPVFVQVELGQRPRRQERGDELVHQVDGDVGRRDEAEQDHGDPRRPGGRPTQPQERGERGCRDREQAAHEHRVGMAPHPAVGRLPGGRVIAGHGLELGEPVVDQVVADVGSPRIRRVPLHGRAGALHRAPGDGLLGPAGPLRDALDHVPVPVAAGERHPGVEARGILAQGRVQAALILDEGPPIHPGDGPQAGDAVGHPDLSERQPPGGPGRRFLRAQRFLGDPLFQEPHGGQRAAHGAELLEKAGDENRGERRRMREKAVELRVEVGLAGLRGAPDASRGRVRRLRLAEAQHRAERHPPDVLDQAQPEHRRYRPELADGEGRDLLEGADETTHVVEANPPLAVRDQRDRQLVDPRISGERATAQHRQLPVVAPRQALAHLADVILHDVIVVEQPFAGGADVHTPVGGGGEARVRVLEDVPGAVEAVEERRPPARTFSPIQPLPRCQGLGSLAQVLGAKQLAPDGAGEQILAGIGTAWDEAGSEPERLERSDGANLQ